LNLEFKTVSRVGPTHQRLLSPPTPLSSTGWACRCHTPRRCQPPAAAAESREIPILPRSAPPFKPPGRLLPSPSPSQILRSFSSAPQPPLPLGPSSLPTGEPSLQLTSVRFRTARTPSSTRRTFPATLAPSPSPPHATPPLPDLAICHRLTSLSATTRRCSPPPHPRSPVRQAKV
jgi:hypothetical protein